MKTICCIILGVFVLFCSPSFAQKVCLRFDAGYALAAASANNYDETENYTGTYSFENVKGGYGRGFSVAAGVGILFAEYFRAEINVNYLKSFTWEYTYQYWDDLIGITSSKYTRKYSMIRINPALTFLPVPDAVARPYASVGVVIGIPNCEYNYDDSDDDNGDDILDVDNKVYEYSGGTPFGMNSALGVEIMAGQRFAFHIEICGTFISYTPHSRSVTSWERDGRDYLHDARVWEKEMEYVEEYTRDYDNIDYDMPRKNTKIVIPASNVEIRAGVTVYLGR
jgi:hypothetical protein